MCCWNLSLFSSRWSGAALVALVTVVAGCGGAKEKIPTLIHVKGKVLLDGAPLTGAAINLIPYDKTTGTGGFGATLADGAFEIMHRSGKPGVEAGTYAAAFSKFAMPDGSPIPEGKNATDVGAKESLPPHLTSPPRERAKYVVMVKDGGENDFTFELTTKR